LRSVLNRVLRRLRGARRDTSGQALTEFAIVAPIIVMVLLFSIWFYELVHIKLKVQEASRYAAWEATSYPLHNYQDGPGQNTQLSADAMQQLQNDTMQRYADLDSSTQNTALLTQIFASAYTQPIVIMTDRQEERIPGGTIANLVLSIGGMIFDYISALNYRSPNPVATTLVATHLTQSWGGAMTDRMFGNSAWGFNNNGYVCSSVVTYVQNLWWNRGVGRFILPNMGVLIKEQPNGLFDNCVLADSWRLNNGESVGGTDNIRPGVASGTGYWRQVDRMYFINSNSRQVADTTIRQFKNFANTALQLAGVSATPPNLGDQDWVQATVVSRPYSGTDAERAGQVTIVQDRGTPNTYDTAPLGPSSSSSGSSSTNQSTLGEYRKTLQNRGEYFMGCQRMMQLGCPSSTLQQDNPFGAYVHREEGSTAQGGNP